MKRIADFFRREKMMSISLALALLSLFISPLTGERIAGLSWKTLSSLFLLFLCLEGFRKENIFSPLERLLSSFRSTFALALSLTMIVFFLSAVITNDVALLTFVPITVMLFKKNEKERFLMEVIIIETIAANLGSMLLPFGNPQNLFLFEKMGISAGEFTLTMLPLWLISLALVVLAIFLVFRKDIGNRIYIKAETGERSGNRSLRILYICLFLLTLATILGAFRISPILAVVTLIVLLFDRKTLLKVDWPLMLTFLCFFVFSSSIASDERIAGMLSAATAGHEFAIGIIASQIISNVPAAILLEPFSENLRALLYGVDAGGLGTPVASLASLISIRLLMKEDTERKGFLSRMILWNVAFLCIIIPLAALLLTR